VATDLPRPGSRRHPRTDPPRPRPIASARCGCLLEQTTRHGERWRPAASRSPGGSPRPAAHAARAFALPRLAIAESHLAAVDELRRSGDLYIARRHLTDPPRAARSARLYVAMPATHAERVAAAYMAAGDASHATIAALAATSGALDRLGLTSRPAEQLRRRADAQAADPAADHRHNGDGRNRKGRPHKENGPRRPRGRDRQGRVMMPSLPSARQSRAEPARRRLSDVHPPDNHGLGPIHQGLARERVQATGIHAELVGVNVLQQPLPRCGVRAVGDAVDRRGSSGPPRKSSRPDPECHRRV
jgi:hypothetical protein